MKDKLTHVIGLMSGTSLDGLDLVFVRFYKDDTTRFKILYGETVPYSDKWKNLLKNAIDLSLDKLQHLDVEYGKLLATITNKFILKFELKKIDFIASHGHTVFHDPDNGITLQIGNGQELAKRTHQKIVCDFRTQDVALGGQGAPLVPIGDALLFPKYDYCLNLGGFANISTKINNQRIAYDVCPVNIVLNHYVGQLGLAYDNKGNIASKGSIDEKLLSELNSLKFYKQSHPKSLGLEWVKTNIFPLIDSYSLSIPDILRTFIEHVAFQITEQISAKNKTLLITGGGVFNSFLITRIQHSSSIKIHIPPTEIIEYKEALIFAFLGLLRVQDKVNVLASVTGAVKDHSSGQIFEHI